jgi:predicted ATP-grasp superfamily ATP-dependent carboligase
MDLNRLYEILAETTRQYGKGEAIISNGAVTEIFDMPAVADAPTTIVKVDVVFMIVGVDKAKAEAKRDELVALLADYPEPERLAGGPSYIETGAVIGDQGAALCLYALGDVLGLWHLIVPATLGITDPEAARKLAGNGFVMMSGFKP